MMAAGEGLPMKASGRRSPGEGRWEKVSQRRPAGEGLPEKAWPPKEGPTGEGLSTTAWPEKVRRRRHQHTRGESEAATRVCEK